ncbi:hypothetical protein JCM12298_10620 [Desulfothermus naphthae]
MKLSQEIFNRVFDEQSQSLRTTSGSASTVGKTLRLEYDANGNVIYKGEADPGSSTSDPVWKIEKYEYDANGNLIAVLFAEGTADFDKVWDNRESYNYL